MQNGQLEIIGLFSKESDHLAYITDFCKDREISLSLLSIEPTEDANVVLRLNKVLNEKKDNLLVLVLNLDYVLISSSLHLIVEKFKRLDQDVIFAASPYFELDHTDLHYFYWKHYPRKHPRYNYLDTSAFAGKRDNLLKLTSSILGNYSQEIKSGQTSLTYLINRFYADMESNCFESEIKVSLDHENVLFTSTRLSAFSRARKRSWMYDLLHFRNEQELFEKAGLLSALKYPVNVTIKDRVFHNINSRTKPLIISLAADKTGSRDLLNREKIILKIADKIKALKLNFTAHYRTLRQLVYIRKINKGNGKPERIFRFAPNKSKVINEATERLVKRLELNLPVSFAHYNDGELTFIRDFLGSKNHEKWFGRKQQQYNPLLAERLHEAMKFRKDGYFVGVPCSTHHPKLRKLADDIVGEYDYKVPAMTIHHNLAYMPRLLYALRNKEVYFFTNEYQDLTFFKEYGIEVNPQKVVKVPFRNSYLEYEKYENMAFPKGAVVVLTCGMLAKILVKTWYEKYSDLSVLALGSSLDDHIQKENIQFKLYPESNPLTKNIFKSRAFLFGYKKRCKECFLY